MYLRWHFVVVVRGVNVNKYYRNKIRVTVIKFNINNITYKWYYVTEYVSDNIKNSQMYFLTLCCCAKLWLCI